MYVMAIRNFTLVLLPLIFIIKYTYIFTPSRRGIMVIEIVSGLDDRGFNSRRIAGFRGQFLTTLVCH
jgi:hypothetical protein